MLICFRVVAKFPPPPAQEKITLLQMDVETLNDAIVDFFVM